MAIVLAAELLPSALRLIAVRSDGRRPPQFVAAITVNPEAAQAREDLRAFRREHRLPQVVQLIYWPRAGDVGVTPIERRPSGREAAMANTLAVRERARVLVRAGFLVVRVVLPHHALAGLAMRHGAAMAVVAALHPTGGCFGFGRRGHASHVASYLVWPASSARVDRGSSPTFQLLQRYQFAALLAPHLRALTGTAPAGSRVVACGALEGLRATTDLLTEELRQEIEVLDEPAEDLASAPFQALAPGPAAWQLAWAVAAAR